MNCSHNARAYRWTLTDHYMSDVELREIAHSYGDKTVLRGLDLRVESGKYLVLLGPSGCGKTTTLSVIAGLCEPDFGSVQLAGRLVRNVPPRDRDVAIVFQNDALYPHLTIRQSIALSLKKRVRTGEQKTRIDEAAELAGIVDLLDRHPDRLSGGELRRAAVAKAIARRTSVRLMDEPLSALDAPLRHSLQDDLIRWHKVVPGTTIHVTHDGQEAMRMADIVAVMEEGRVVQCDTPEVIYDRPNSRSVAKAVGTFPINLMPVSQLGESLAFQNGWRLSDREELGIRPETLRLAEESVTGPGLTIQGQVQQIRRIDSRFLVSFSVGKLTALAVVDQTDGIEPGREVRFFASATDTMRFDPVTGKACADDNTDAVKSPS